jgi:hypothetical protein
MLIAALACALLATGAARCAAQTVIGNWESETPEGWFDWNTGTLQEATAPRFAFNSIGATLGTKALQFTLASGYTQWAAIKLQRGPGGPPSAATDWQNGIDEWRDDFMNSTKLMFDLTLVGAEMTPGAANDYATINPVINADGFGFNSIVSHLESVSNNADNLFQAPARNSFNPQQVVGSRTFTFTYDIKFTHDAGGVGAPNAEINANPNYIELLFETYSNGGIVFHLDNVRLVTPGDFDNNNVVDRNDLVDRWKPGFGLTGQLDDSNGDADGDGDVDGNDFLIWQRNVEIVPVASAALTTVPEPAAGVLACLALACAIAARGSVGARVAPWR